MIQSTRQSIGRGLLLFLLLLWGGVVQAQLATFYPLELRSDPDAALEQTVGGATQLTLDRAELLRLYEADAEDLRVTLPLAGGGKWALHLTKARVLTDDFRLTDHTGRELPFEAPRTYRGIVHGRPGCWVAASFSRAGLMAVIVTPEGAFNLGPQGAAGDTSGRYVLFNERELKVELPHRECQVEEPPQDPHKDFDPDRVMNGAYCYVITKLFICDFQMYLDFNRSVQRVADYVTGMYNVVAMIYDREEIMTQIARIQVYTAADPFINVDNGRDILNRATDLNLLREFPNISLAHFISARRSLQGWGYYDVLCSRPAVRLSVGFVAPFYSELPVYSWPVQYTSVLLGFNLGSWATNDCRWPSGPIDGCAPVEGGNCARPPIPEPPFKGTIMSRCQMLPGIGVDLNLGLGPIPGERVRSRVSRAFCETQYLCDCFAPRVPTVTTDSSGTRARVEWIGSPRAGSFTLDYRIRFFGTWTSVGEITGYTYELENLQPDTEYELRIRANCFPPSSRNPSNWSLIYFTTPRLAAFCEPVARPQVFTDFVQVTDGSGLSDYRNNTNCRFEYRTASGRPIDIVFLEFQTERNYDFLRVYDGVPGSGGIQLGSFSGSVLPQSLRANSGVVYLEFTTDGSITYSGWRLLLKEIPEENTTFCQGMQTLTAEFGSFDDGSGPDDYANDSDCQWLIQPQNAQQIRIQFTEFQTEARFDFVSVYDGPTVDAPLLGRFSGFELPPVLLTSGPSALVVFTSDPSVTAPGWRISYQGITRTGRVFCRGLQRRTALADTVTDGSGAQPYAPNSSCRWLIEPEGAEAIEINFTEFHTEVDQDYVAIFAGPSIESPLVGIFSGQQLPRPLEIFSTSVLIVFQTNELIQESGWKLSYRVLEIVEESFCRGTQLRTALNDTITDGSGTANYANNSDCRWLIQPPNTQRIVLAIQNLDTERERDELRIYDGSDDTAPLLGTFSGSVRNQQLIATSGAAFVVFTSDEQNTAAGWQLSYNAEEIPDPVFCRGEQTRTAPTDTITDGSGPFDYGNNSACSWLIQPDSASNIRITFDSLRTELGFDFVTIHDGPTAQAPVLGRFSGSNLPAPLVTSQGTALVVFNSDFSITDAGFGLRYEALFNTEPVFCRGQQTRTATADTITDGSGTENYGPNSFCQWLVQPEGARSILLTFEAFDTERNRDFVTFYAGFDMEAPLVGRFSGSELPPMVEVTAPVVLVVFTSDEQNQGTGWQLRYRGVSAEQTRFCHGQQTVTARSGEIEDGSGGRLYGPNSDCRWLIAPPNARSLELTFLQFDLEEQFDNVWVYDGPTENDRLLGRFSGTQLPPVLRTTGGQALIVFRTDRTVQGQGWRLRYEGTFPPEPRHCLPLDVRTAASDTITDGSGASNYFPNVACRWLIAPEGAGNLTIDFLAFDTESRADFVTVYAGSNIQAPVIGRFSGRELPPRIVTGTGTALIQFESNAAFERSGWALRYQAEFPACRGTQVHTARTDTISDGSGALPYGPNSDCRWRIRPDGARNVVIQFLEFDTQADTDFVSLYAGPDERSPLLGRFSGQTLPERLDSRSNEVLVVFRSDAFVHGAGWQLRYTGEIPQCSGLSVRTAATDTITDGSGTAPYGPLSDCQWRIDVPGADSLILTFERFATAGVADVLIIFDGPDATARVLGRFSGTDLPPRLVTSTGRAFIAFATDRTEHADGWQLRYEAVFPPVFCGGIQTRTAPTDTITDGSTPNRNYGPNSDCQWLIKVAGADSLRLRFDRFATADSADVLTVFDGTDADAPILGRFWGQNLPPALTTSSGQARLHFVSDALGQASGWQLRYEAVFPPPPPVFCRDRQVRTAALDTISDGSPAEELYGPNSRCEWLIRPTEPVETLILSFDRFDTEAVADRVRVYAGEAATPIAQLFEHSGDRIPEPVVVPGGVALVTFSSNGSVEGRGWQLRYGPGPTVRQSDGGRQLQFQLYPNPTTGRVGLHFSHALRGSARVEVIDLLGRVVAVHDLGSESRTAELDLQHLMPGSYLFRISQGTDLIGVQKLIRIQD